MSKVLDHAGTPASPADTPGGAGGGRLARRLMLVLKIGATLLALFLVARLVNPATLWARVQAASPFVFAAAILLALVQIPLVGERWRLIVASMNRLGGPLPGRLQFQRITYIAQFFGQVLPFVAGDGMRVLLLREAGPSLRIAFKSTLLDRGLAALVLFVIALPPALLSPLLASARAFLWPVILFISAGLVGAAVLLASVDVLHRIGQRWRFVGAVTETLHDVRAILVDRSYGWRIIGLCAAVHAISILVFWLLAQGQRLPFEVVDALAIVPLVLIVAMVPIAVGGWGVREGFIVALLGAGGVGAEDALLLSLSFGTVFLVAALPGVAILALSTRASTARAEATP